MRDKHAAGRRASWGVSAADTILALPRETKRMIMMTADAVAIPTALWAALALKFDRLDPSLERTFAYFLVAIGSAMFFFAIFGLYRAVLRFMGPKAMMTVIAGVSLSVLVLAAFDRSFASHQIPLTAFGIYWALALPWVGGSRVVARYLFLRRSGAKGTSARVAIYGAGDAGARVCATLLGGPGFQPVAFIDDKKSLQGSSINGIAVYGPEGLQELVRRRRIDRILLAMPSTSRRRRREILTALEPLGVHVQSLPNLSDLISGKAQISERCDVDVSERSPGCEVSGPAEPAPPMCSWHFLSTLR
jgi:FlaA1/EpsC-like NDP-sugar epimerase